MSAGIPRCAFFAIVLRFNVIDCVSSSTSQHGTSTPSTIEDQQSPTTVTNSFTSHDDNTTAPLWLAEALRDIAYYLRAHKFNEYDRRYEPDAKLARREYYRSFPRPPLRSLHWEVHKYCDESLIECANYLRKRVKNTGLKRIDDTAAVIHEQQWNVRNNSKQIEIVNQDCIKMKEADDIQANPFEGRDGVETEQTTSVKWQDCFLKHNLQLVKLCRNLKLHRDATKRFSFIIDYLDWPLNPELIFEESKKN
ncbi:hypothetical protein Zmor_001465 [Zophobas morio]|uniref:Uncharacterized protein n=1 Tax=Zophobas morio TaxID=2755281 RepID=A0AA38MPB0_9CUCU|nr:hypothetical protein Zmor_001465 [Zophobas morio]